MFQPAVRQQGKLKMALTGPAGSGKTLTAMRVINYFAGDKPWCVLDTEDGTAAKYAGYGGFHFAHATPEKHHPEMFIKAIVEAYKSGYAGLIIDSLSHEWMGTGGCLETIEDLTKKSKSGNSFQQWNEVTALHNKLMGVIKRVPIHIACTFRVKTGYEMQRNERTGKMEPVKIGLEPVTGKGAEYEFDFTLDMNKATGVVSKSRCPQLEEDTVIRHPGEEMAEVLAKWLNGETPATNLFLDTLDTDLAATSVATDTTEAPVSAGKKK